MLRIVDLEAQSREKDTTVYMVSVGDDKVGIAESDLIDLIKTKLARVQARRQAPKHGRALVQDETTTETLLPPMPLARSVAD